LLHKQIYCGDSYHCSSCCRRPRTILPFDCTVPAHSSP
jgi:hypothetical protein